MVASVLSPKYVFLGGTGRLKPIRKRGIEVEESKSTTYEKVFSFLKRILGGLWPILVREWQSALFDGVGTLNDLH